MKLKQLTTYLMQRGLIAMAIQPEVDSLDAVPEFQRGWYAQDAGGKFKIDFSKVEVEDVTGLRNTVAATRKEAAEAKRLADQRIADALRPYEGIDPVKTKAMLSKFTDDEEAALIADNKFDEVIARRSAKRDAELQRQVDEAHEQANGALEVASTFMERVLDNHVRAAAADSGLHPSAIEDALLRARAIFSLNDEGEAVQFYEDGETVVLGKDGKTPFSPREWLESMKQKAPHWFPAGGSGGGSMGNKVASGGRDLSGLSPQQRMTMARATVKK